MSNAIINHEKHEYKIANSISKNKETTFANSIEEISSSETNTNLLSSKPLIHSAGAGINPLVDSAAYVFAWMGKLSQMRSLQNLQQLHIELLEEIQEFRASLTRLNYMPKYLSEEYIPIATYLLCKTLDDIIEHKTWGRDGKWEEYRLLNFYHQENLSKENFLILLERFIQDQEIFIDMLEFTYICLNLGFSYRCPMSGFSIEQLQRIMYSLYKRIRTHSGNFSKTLSPYSLKISYACYSQPGWLSSPMQLFKKAFSNYRVTSSLYNRHPIISQEIKSLKLNFYRMTGYLSNKSFKIKQKKIQLASLPWVLITGSIGSGKSTLIENSKINFVIDKNKIQNDLKNGLEHNNWNWWITPRAVLIDVPSSHILLKRDQNLFSNAYLENLLDLIEQERGPAGVNSVAVVVSLPEIVDKSKHQILIQQLVKKITELQNRFGKGLSLNLIINKCDLIAGFCDFFDDYTNEELFQPWGVSLPQTIKSDNITNCFYKPFDSLIQRLNKQVIYRLHQERYLESQNKFHIKDFPLQLELLKENLGEVIKKVAQETNHFVLNGFYLTSAKQFPLSNNQLRISKVIPDNELQSFSIMDIPTVHDRSYFIKNLLFGGLVSGEN